jgi:TRAP-type C4-dicarboxylate transport system substrate-binding protein
MGGIIMNRTAWRRIPDKYKEPLMRICKRIEGEIDGSIGKLENDAISTMSRYGLVINQPTPQQQEEWYQEMSQHEAELVGSVFNKDLYQKITAILQEYRRGR